MPVVLLKLLHTSSRQLLCCTSSSCSCRSLALLLQVVLPLQLPCLLLLARKQLCVRGAVLPPAANGRCHICSAQQESSRHAAREKHKQDLALYMYAAQQIQLHLANIMMVQAA
jgi:hypothetical protein